MHRKAVKILGAIIACFGIVLATAGIAEARDRIESWGNVEAFYGGSPGFYQGTVADPLNDGNCVGVERRFNATEWTTTGFTGTRNVCNNPGGASWNILGSAATATQGIRIHSGSHIANLCLGAADCRSM